ncbi:MAG: glycerol-3-phosphate 1-O-acyltransferase PlsY [Chloroflexi bacterium]|nr:glycerol-3-phosphate 1-O-acyltransferase PlsY [Chloroflexota bacterium]
MIDYFIFVPIGYLIGSIPFGYVVVRFVLRKDVRQIGSGKTGMTNVIRAAGTKVGILVLLLDMAKSVVAIALPIAFVDTPGADVGAGLAALIGHIWPLYIGFKGGSGVAPGWGGLFMLWWLPGLIGTAIGIPLVYLTRHVSVGSLVGATSGALSIIVFAALGYVPTEYMWYGIIGAPLIVLRHRGNISRLLRGEERKISGRTEQQTTKQ